MKYRQFLFLVLHHFDILRSVGSVLHLFLSILPSVRQCLLRCKGFKSLPDHINTALSTHFLLFPYLSLPYYSPSIHLHSNQQSRPTLSLSLFQCFVAPLPDIPFPAFPHTPSLAPRIQFGHTCLYPHHVFNCLPHPCLMNKTL